MIIDVHTHVGSKNGIQASAKQLVASMDSAKIDKAIVLAADLFDCPTPKLLEEIKNYPDRLYPVGSVTFDREISQIEYETHSQQLDYLTDLFEHNQLFGIKFYTGYQHIYPHDSRLRRFFSLLTHYQKPAIFHSGDTFNCCRTAKLKYAHPLHLDEVAVDFPGLKIIIAHLGFPWITDTAEVIYKNPNVYTDCSGFVYGDFSYFDREKFSKAIEQFREIAGDTKRILFGTDWPISSQAPYLDVYKEFVEEEPDSKLVSSLFGIR